MSLTSDVIARLSAIRPEFGTVNNRQPSMHWYRLDSLGFDNLPPAENESFACGVGVETERTDSTPRYGSRAFEARLVVDIMCATPTQRLAGRQPHLAQDYLESILSAVRDSLHAFCGTYLVNDAQGQPSKADSTVEVRTCHLSGGSRTIALSGRPLGTQEFSVHFTNMEG